jgi:hypothetical protein
MADKNKKFTVKSDKVLGERPKEKDIVVDVPNTSLKGQSSTPSISANFKQPEISTNISYGAINTKTDNINIEIDLKGLGEERQPDKTKFIFQPDTYSVTEDSILDTIKSEKDLYRVTDQFEFDVIAAYADSPNLKDSDFKSIDTLKEDIAQAPEFISHQIEIPFENNSQVFDYNELSIEPNKSDNYFVTDDSFRIFEKFLFDRITATDDAFGNLNPDDDQTAGVINPEFDTSSVSDFDSKGVTKAFTEITSILDAIQYMEYLKVVEEKPTAVDTKEIEVLTGANDTSISIDAISNLSSKPFSDSLTNSDYSFRLINPGKSEILAPSELLDKVFYKSIFDFITATDDALGNLNPDDDQAGITEKPQTDTSGVADVNYRLIIKGLFDVVNTVDDFSVADDSIKETNTISDLVSSAIQKIVDEDYIRNSDNTTLNPRPNKLDTTTASDILTTVVSFFYEPSETAEVADSGLINQQDYFQQEYTNDDYIGQNFTF